MWCVAHRIFDQRRDLFMIQKKRKRKRKQRIIWSVAHPAPPPHVTFPSPSLVGLWREEEENERGLYDWEKGLSWKVFFSFLHLLLPIFPFLFFFIFILLFFPHNWGGWFTHYYRRLNDYYWKEREKNKRTLCRIIFLPLLPLLLPYFDLGFITVVSKWCFCVELTTLPFCAFSFFSFSFFFLLFFFLSSY